MVAQARSGASPRSRPNRRAASAKVCRRSMMRKSRPCWANLTAPAAAPWHPGCGCSQQPLVAAAPRLPRPSCAARYLGRAQLANRRAMSERPLSELRKPPPPVASPPSALKTIRSTKHAGAWCGAVVAAFLTAWFLAFFRFFLPRTLFEPATSFKIGYPADYGLGVDTKWQQKYRIWVDRTPDRIVRDLRSLHSPGLHSRLEAQREQVQVSLPRQRLRQ